VVAVREGRAVPVVTPLPESVAVCQGDGFRA
jgi:hypothetical protein